jgi:uncharacterized membrane protein
MNIFTIANIFFGLLGVFVAYKIKTNKALKNKGQQMVCLVGHKCDEVVFSDYSKFFGINLEIMGFVYYIFISIFYLIFLVNSAIITNLVMFFALGITFGGFLFSIYLTYIQVFKLKSFCSWCLSSAAISSIIFFSSYAMTLLLKPEIISYISSIHDYIRAFEFISLVLGIGIFTVLEITTFSFLRDFKITLKESLILKNISQVGWFVLFLFILNNFGVYLPEKYLPNLNQNFSSTLFVIEIVIILIISINALINQTQVLPEIQKRSINPNVIPVQHIKKLRLLAILQGIISLVLWYGLFYLNFML